MNRLIKASELKKRYLMLEKEIAELSAFIEKCLDSDNDLKLKTRFLNSSEPIKNNKGTSYRFSGLSGLVIESSNKKNWDCSIKINSIEAVVVYGALLSYKKTKLNEVLNEYKSLELSLKI